MRTAVFLDRDGTVMEDEGYLCECSGIRVFPFSATAIRRLNDADVAVVVVTNQSAVARGLCTVDQVESVNRAMLERIEAEGGRIDAVYWCPFHPEGSVEKYSRPSSMRKPSPGMLHQAARELKLDLRKSVMIGDKLSDIAAGKAADCRTILVRTGYGKESLTRINADRIHPDHVVADLREAVDLWLQIRPDGHY